MLLPYRVKNPTKRFPIATVSIIALNVIVFAATVGDGLGIRESVADAYAFGLGSTPLFTFFSACFLHADPIHLIGNMLFLWVFGPPVEDRVGIPKYILIYFVTGFCGDLLQGSVDAMMMGHIRPGIGASGCIMGVLGAYWYLFSWSTVCVFYWFGWFWRGVWEVQAMWVILLYMVWDVVQGLLGISGGVANFAHVGGGFAGLCMCYLMKEKRDSEAVSEAKAIHADTKDLSLAPLHALQSMLEADPQNPDLLRALIPAAQRAYNQGAIENAFAEAGLSMIDKDPALVAHYLVDLRGMGSIYRPMHILRLAGLVEQSGNAEKAIKVYRVIVDRYPTDQDAETALFRMAQCAWNAHRDVVMVQSCLSEMVKRFPRGQMTPYGKALWQQVQQAGAGRTRP